MGAPSGSWETLAGDGDRALEGEGFSVRARTQARPDELWLSVQLPDGSWSYVVLREGDVVVHEHAGSKRDAYHQALEAVADVTVG